MTHGTARVYVVFMSMGRAVPAQAHQEKFMRAHVYVVSCRVMLCRLFILYRVMPCLNALLHTSRCRTWTVSVGNSFVACVCALVR